MAYTWGSSRIHCVNCRGWVLGLLGLALMVGLGKAPSHAQNDARPIYFQEISILGEVTYSLVDLNAGDRLYLTLQANTEAILAIGPDSLSADDGFEQIASGDSATRAFIAYWELAPYANEVSVRIPDDGTYRLWVADVTGATLLLATNARFFEGYMPISALPEAAPAAIAVLEAPPDTARYGFVSDGLVPGDVDYFTITGLRADDYLLLHMATDFYDGFQWELMQTRVDIGVIEAYQQAEHAFFDGITDAQRSQVEQIYSDYGDDYTGAWGAVQDYYHSLGLPENPMTTLAPIFRQSSYTGNRAEYLIPADGDYVLMVWATPNLKTILPYDFGVGVNPISFSGLLGAEPDFGIVRRDVSVVTHSVVEGTLPATSGVVSFKLAPMVFNEVLTVDFEVLSDTPIPQPKIALVSETVFFDGAYSDATNPNRVYLFFYLPDDILDGELRVSVPNANGVSLANLRYRLTIGVEAQRDFSAEEGVFIGPTPENENKVDLAGRRAVLVTPTVIDIGLEILQFTNIDQKSETFSVVGILRAAWRDPVLDRELAVALDLAGIYSGLQVGGFINSAVSHGLTIPEFTFYNQVAGREIQSRLLSVQYDGTISYEERFSVRLRAAEFEFRTIPFDTQRFHILIEPIYPEQQFVLRAVERFNRGIAPEHGEEEWAFAVATSHTQAREDFSQFRFEIEAQRRLNFYIFRMFVPLFIILSIGWATFFIQSYDSRITVASGNLLLFIAFNFTIGGELPRLGYLTFLDTLLLACFVITAAVFAMNIYLKRMDDTLDARHKRRLDRALIVGYPLLFGVGVVALLFIFGVA